MDFSYDDEQVALRDAVRGLVGKTYADHDHRRSVTADDPGYDQQLWARMAEMEEIVGRLSDAPPVSLARLERAMASVRPEAGEIDALVAKREELLALA